MIDEDTIRVVNVLLVGALVGALGALVNFYLAVPPVRQKISWDDTAHGILFVGKIGGSGCTLFPGTGPEVDYLVRFMHRWYPDFKISSYTITTGWL